MNSSPKSTANLPWDSAPEELKEIQAYFKKEKRNPTDVELQTISQTWSEHCCHKTFKGKIQLDGKEINSLFKTYIAKATKQIRAPWCVSVFEDNAGIVKFDKGYGIAAKVETHNHPSAVEPFGGAATGVGGVIRDILGVWADPIACTDVLGFGPLDYDYNKFPAGVKHPKYVYMGVTAGISAYGNNMGIPTVNGAIYFDDILHRQRHRLLRLHRTLTTKQIRKKRQSRRYRRFVRRQNWARWHPRRNFRIRRTHREIRGNLATSRSNR